MNLARMAVADRPCPLRRHDPCRRRRAWLRIIGACEEVSYTAWRDRVLTPVTTIQLFLLPMLHGNTACSHLPHLSGLQFTASAYCQARRETPATPPCPPPRTLRQCHTASRLTKSCGTVIARFSSMARAAPCPTRPPYRTPSASRRCSGRAAAFPGAPPGPVPCGHWGAPEAGRRPPPTHDRAQVQQVHPM